MKERESLLRATPFGGKENGSNGSCLASCDTDFGREKVCLSPVETHLSNFEIMQSKVVNDVPQRYTTHMGLHYQRGVRIT
jgi:hypothetical protein